ncbi:MAG: helix-turn-helix domain-containing protein [Methanococcaceae archaeon]
MITSADKEFLERILLILNNRITDESFGVRELAKEAAVNRFLLYKKIHMLIGESPVCLIRRERLIMAAELIKNDFGNIAETAFEVGFSNAAYFSECFKKEFGLTPSKYKNSFHNDFPLNR